MSLSTQGHHASSKDASIGLGASQAVVPKKRLYICDDFADYTRGTERSAPARKIIALGGGKGVLLGKPI